MRLFSIASLLLAVFALGASSVSAAENQKYIIVFKETDSTSLNSVIDKVSKDIEAAGGKVGKKFTIMPAISAELPPNSISTLEQSPEIDYIEADQPVHAYGDA